MYKCYLDKLEKVEEEFILDKDLFFEKYYKVDIFIGDSNTIDFIEEKLKNFINEN